MAVNKVTYNGTTLIDLTGDTVTPETLAKGVIAHDASGNIIVGIAELAQKYKNLVLTSIGTDGEVYNNGLGYMDGYRLSSSGGVSSSPVAEATHTGFIKFTKGDVIRIKVKGELDGSYSGNYYHFYNTSFGLALTTYPNGFPTSSTGTKEILSDGDTLITILTAKLVDLTSTEYYLRISFNPAKGEDLIVTVNEEIK